MDVEVSKKEKRRAEALKEEVSLAGNGIAKADFKIGLGFAFMALGLCMTFIPSFLRGAFPLHFEIANVRVAGMVCALIGVSALYLVVASEFLAKMKSGMLKEKKRLTEVGMEFKGAGLAGLLLGFFLTLGSAFCKMLYPADPDINFFFFMGVFCVIFGVLMMTRTEHRI